MKSELIRVSFSVFEDLILLKNVSKMNDVLLHNSRLYSIAILFHTYDFRVKEDRAQAGFVVKG